MLPPSYSFACGDRILDVPSFVDLIIYVSSYFLSHSFGILYKVEFNLYDNIGGSREGLYVVCHCLLFDGDPLDCCCFWSDEGFFDSLVSYLVM